MIYLIFKDGVCIGYATVPYSSDDPAEVTRQVSEAELVALAGPDWEEHLHRLNLVNGELIFE